MARRSKCANNTKKDKDSRLYVNNCYNLFTCKIKYFNDVACKVIFFCWRHFDFQIFRRDALQSDSEEKVYTVNMQTQG